MQACVNGRSLWLGMAIMAFAVGCADTPVENEELGEQGDTIHVAREAITRLASWTGWMSEEFGGPLICSPGQVVIGANCDGSFCDQVQLRCDMFGSALNASAPMHWTGWVETGGDIFGNNTIREATCSDGEWMTGMDCRGSYCDDVRAACQPSDARAINCAWTTALYSEESGPYNASEGRYLRGVHCEGEHCDNKRYYVCSARPSPQLSCSGHCGGVASSGSCWCDTECSKYGDCCADKGDFCS